MPAKKVTRKNVYKQVKDKITATVLFPYSANPPSTAKVPFPFWDHSFSKYAKSSEKLTLPIRVRIRE